MTRGDRETPTDWSLKTSFAIHFLNILQEVECVEASISISFQFGS